jgi:hypothetical protein
MPKVPLSTITSGYGTVDALNANFDAIEAAFDNTLSRDGDVPNQMAANLDMNNYALLNVGNINGVTSDTLASLDNLDSLVDAAEVSATQAAQSAEEAEAFSLVVQGLGYFLNWGSIIEPVGPGDTNDYGSIV